MFDRLPTPWGLVRLGVAPDHPKIKSVSRAFERIAQRPGFRFFGNVEVGRDLAHDELTELYDAVVYAFGAQADRRMSIPGEDLPGSWPATAFVAWYNGHPDFQDLPFDLSARAGRRRRQRERRRRRGPDARAHRGGDRADRHDRRGDRRDPRLGDPRDPRPRPPRPGAGRVHDAGAAGADRARRAPTSSIDPADLELDPASEAALEDDTAIARRNVELLREVAGKPPTGKPKTVVLRFGVSPVAILGDGRVEAVEVVRNELVAGRERPDPRRRRPRSAR